jgi:geranylgeranyl pyrophosphate synthase
LSSSQRFEEEKVTIDELIEVLISRHDFGPQLQKALFRDDGKRFRPMVLVAVNGKNALLGQGLKKMLKEGDRVSIGTVSSGG